MKRPRILVLGAGPAGLAAAVRLASRDRFDVTVLERAPAVGGNAGSFELEGLPVDFGSHRLHPSCPPAILADIREMLGEDLLLRPRHGRIRLGGRWIHFPLKPLDLAFGVPPWIAFGVVSDWVRKGAGQDGGGTAGQDRTETFADVLERGLGRTICREFYFPYALKIWGLPPCELDAEQARRRVSAGSVGTLLRKVASAIPGFRPARQGQFYYPRQGFGQISEAYRARAAALGARVVTGADVQAIAVKGGRVTHAAVGAGGGESHACDLMLSTIPVPSLVRLFAPPAPDAVITAVRSLRSRAMVLVYLVLETDRFTEFDAHYFPEPGVRITRVSEPKNYGLTERPGLTVLCAELPCAVGDEAWQKSTEDLGALVVDALGAAGLPVRCAVRHVAVRRLPHAYPVYSRGYRRHLDTVEGWLGAVEGIVTFGRQGLFVHDNTHHTLAMAYAAAECVDDEGRFDGEAWANHRKRFESHVVED